MSATNTDVLTRLTAVFREVLAQPSLQLEPETTANDVEGWDSLTHIDLIVAVEKSFGVAFTTREVRGLKKVGDLVELVQKKISG